jgi:hypothetical protein
VSSTLASPPGTDPAQTPPRRRAVTAALAAGALLAAVIIVILTVGYIPVPGVPRLADAPDASIAGTVAYLADGPGDTTCVLAIEASGGTSRELMCTPGWVEAVHWTTDGTLAIVINDNLGASLLVVDPTYGRTLDTIPFSFERPTPLEGLAEAPGPSTSRDGRTIRLTSDGDGHVDLTFTAASGATTTTLVDLRGPRDYELRWATWSPDDRWILFGDSRGRLMIVGSDGRDGPRLLAEAGGRWWKTTASWLMPDIAPGPVDLSSLPTQGRGLR